MKKSLSILSAAALAATSCMAAEVAQRPLRIALYPYVPDIEVFKSVLTDTWSRTGRPEEIHQHFQNP